MGDVYCVNRCNDRRKIDIIEKAGIKRPFEKLNVDLSYFLIKQVSKIRLLFKGIRAYYTENMLHFGKRDYELSKNGGSNKCIIHELAHDVHLDLCKAYLKSSDEDLVINSLDFLFNKYSGREGLHKELVWYSSISSDLRFDDFTPKGFSKYLSNSRTADIIGYHIFKEAARSVVEGFAVYVSNDNILKTTASCCTIGGFVLTLLNLEYYLLFLNPANIGLAVFNYCLFKKYYPFAQGVYDKWKKEYNSAERLALLAFPPRKKSETDKLLETLEEYSLILH